MNANEMADIQAFETDELTMWIRHETATMLRQQQAEIEKWTDQYQRLNENLEMWKAGHFKQQVEIEELKTCLIVEQEHNERMVEDRSKYEALAHAGGVEAGKELKELTNEEIKSEAKYFCHSWYSQNPERLVLFAKAILRKAQEK